MEGWVVLASPAMHRPGIELAISRLRVQRPNHYTIQSHPLITLIDYYCRLAMTAWVALLRNTNGSTCIHVNTRKLCYRKDDRAMRPTYGCPENFRDSLTTPTATIPNIFMGFCSDRLWMFLQNLKSVALPVPEIIGGTQKIWAVPGYAHAPFSQTF